MAKPDSAAFQANLKTFFQLGAQHDCPRDQLLNFSHAGLILQARQLAAGAAARRCDQPAGPRAIGYGVIWRLKVSFRFGVHGLWAVKGQVLSLFSLLACAVRISLFLRFPLLSVGKRTHGL